MLDVGVLYANAPPIGNVVEEAQIANVVGQDMPPPTTNADNDLGLEVSNTSGLPTEPSQVAIVDSTVANSFSDLVLPIVDSLSTANSTQTDTNAADTAANYPATADDTIVPPSDPIAVATEGKPMFEVSETSTVEERFELSMG